MYRFLSVASLVVVLLGVAAWTASLWTVSYRKIGVGGGTDLSVALMRGELWCTTSGTYFGPGFQKLYDKPQFDRLVWGPVRPFYERRIAGIGGSYTVSMPIWWIAALGGMGFVAACVGRGAQRRGRRRRRACVRCAYDLSGSGDRCPECGTAVVARRSGLGTEPVSMVETPARKQ